VSDPRARLLLTAENQTDPAFRDIDSRLRQLERSGPASTAKLTTGMRDLRGAAMGVRNVLAGFGLVLSARAIGDWIEKALQANQVTDQQRGQLQASALAMERLNAGAQGLAITIGTQLAPAIETAANWWRRFLFPTEGEKVEDQITEMSERALTLSRTLVELTERDPFIDPAAVQRYRDEIVQLQRQISAAKGERDELLISDTAKRNQREGIEPGFNIDEFIGQMNKEVEARRASEAFDLDSFLGEMNASVEARARAEWQWLDDFLGEMNAEVEERARAQAASIDDMLGEINAAVAQRQQEALKDLTIELDPEAEEIASMRRKQQVLLTGLQEKQITETRYAELSIQLAEQTERRITNIRTSEMKKQQQARVTMLFGVSTLFAGIAAISAAGANESKKRFEQDKKIQTASAIVNTLAGVTQALASYPPPVSFAWAAAVAALGFAQVRQIQATTFSGGSASFAGGGGAGSAAVPPTNERMDGLISGRDTGGRGGNTLNVYLTGIGRIDGETARELGRAIGQEINNNDFEFMLPSSRQVLTIRGGGAEGEA
jgi:uncharacterized protein YgfB (UPF0149 family)